MFTDLKQEISEYKVKIESERKLAKAEIPMAKKPKEGLYRELPDDP